MARLPRLVAVGSFHHLLIWVILAFCFWLVGSDSTHPTPSGSEPGPGGGHIELARRLVIHLGGSESSP